MASIRPGEPSDVAAITDLYNALLETTTFEWTETPHTLEERAEWFRAKVASGHPVLVALDAGLVVGTATYGDFRDSVRWPGYRFTVEHSVHMAESRWGSGLGRALMDRLFELARLDGKRMMVAAVDGSNLGSIGFHEHLGFREVGRLPGVGDKWGRPLDLVLLQREI
jgi:L-amino acid N-acyltransferase YncA